MRYEFRKEMAELQDTLTAQARSAATAMKRSAASLRDANLALAESVIDADAQIDLLERTVDDMGISLRARQAPVAGDLRTVVSALRLGSTLERMGDLARHVAYIARGRFPMTAAEGDAYDLLMRETRDALGNRSGRQPPGTVVRVAAAPSGTKSTRTPAAGTAGDCSAAEVKS